MSKRLEAIIGVGMMLIGPAFFVSAFCWYKYMDVPQTCTCPVEKYEYTGRMGRKFTRYERHHTKDCLQLQKALR